MKAITQDETLRKNIHNIYLALYKAFKACPETLKPHDMTRMLTSLMAAKHWSWRVIGITPAALAEFAAVDFNRPVRKLQRGHKIDRAITAKDVFDRDEPMGLTEFFKFFLKRDQTVIMTNEENKHRKEAKFPEYIKLSNPNAQLFPSGSLIGWQHRKMERDFLRQLWKQQNSKSGK